MRSYKIPCDYYENDLHCPLPLILTQIHITYKISNKLLVIFVILSVSEKFAKGVTYSAKDL